MFKLHKARLLSVLLVSFSILLLFWSIMSPESVATVSNRIQTQITNVASLNNHQHQQRFIDPLFHFTNLKAGEHFEASIFLQKQKHPLYDVVIDVGVFDATDYTIPAYKLGYTVFAFELDPKNIVTAVRNIEKNGWRAGVDYTMIDVVPGQPPVFDSSKRPHIYFFRAGVSNVNAGVSIQGSDVWTHVDMKSSSNADASSGGRKVAVVKIDDIVKPHEKVYLLKTDTQGHEFAVFDGAKELLSSRGSVNLVQLEMWPEGMLQSGFTAEDTLNRLMDHGFRCYDMGFHKHYNLPSRPSELKAYVKYLMDVPRSQDAIGGWDDMFCSPSFPLH